MKEITTEEIQAIELSLAAKTTELLERNRIWYSIFYGSMLGAVRHKGFIPWDDDFDIVVMQEDVPRVETILRNIDDGVMFLSSNILRDYSDWPMRVSDKKTYTLHNPDAFQSRKHDTAYENLGVTLDIYPLIKVPRKKALFSLFLLTFKAGNKLVHLSHRKGRRNKILYMCGKRYVNGFAYSLYKIDSNYWYITQVDYKVKYDPQDIEKTIDIRFENMKFKICVGYGKILETKYGDYMRLPSEEERAKWIHFNKVFRKE